VYICIRFPEAPSSKQPEAQAKSSGVSPRNYSCPPAGADDPVVDISLSAGVNGQASLPAAKLVASSQASAPATSGVPQIIRNASQSLKSRSTESLSKKTLVFTALAQLLSNSGGGNQQLRLPQTPSSRSSTSTRHRSFFSPPTRPLETVATIIKAPPPNDATPVRPASHRKLDMHTSPSSITTPQTLAVSDFSALQSSEAQTTDGNVVPADGAKQAQEPLKEFRDKLNLEFRADSMDSYLKVLYVIHNLPNKAQALGLLFVSSLISYIILALLLAFRSLYFTSFHIQLISL
jgi:hypothetical protein